MPPCDICLERECKAKNGPGTCNCEKCNVREECPRKLRATIRITMKCTQSCAHCCFECSPKNDKHMTLEKAMEVARFLKSNDVFSVNLMGGEVFCNPEWRDITRTLAESVTIMRIVSNGDWAVAEPDFAEVVGSIHNCYVSLSKDKWHTNANIELAERLLKEAGVKVRVSILNEKEETMVPIGRSRFEYGFYSFMGCYCHNPEYRYTFLINEDGRIHKCGFGVWDYDGIDEYLDGGFRERFKEFNKKFYGVWIPHCRACIRAYENETRQ